MSSKYVSVASTSGGGAFGFAARVILGKAQSNVKTD